MGEGCDLWGGEGAGGHLGVDACPVEGFVGVDVADAGDAGLIEEEGFDGAVAVGEGVGELGGGEGEGVGSEVVEGVASREEPYAAEAAWVAVDEAACGCAVALEVPGGVDVVGLWGALAGRDDEELAGHAEVGCDRSML